MKKVVLFFSILCCTQWLGAQSLRSEWPYRLVGGKMLVDMEIEGTSCSFIFDTGGRTALTEACCTALGLYVTDSLSVTDVNSRQTVYPVVTIQSLQTPDKRINFTGVPALLIPSPDPFECFGAKGLIGSDLLSRFIVTIDPCEKKITLTSAEIAPAASLRRMVAFSGNTMMPVIPLQLGTHTIEALFDTGNPAFFSFKGADFESLKSSDAFQVMDQGISEGSIGVSGMGETGSFFRVLFPRLSVAGIRFKEVVSETSDPPYSLLGVKLLEYGKVTIDYPRRRFYFESEENEHAVEYKKRSVALRVKSGELVISSLWGAWGSVLELGDKVVAINGKPTGKYDFCESIINGIPELNADGKVEITVRTKDGEKTIVYKE